MSSSPPYQPWLDEAKALARNASTVFLTAQVSDVTKEFCRRTLVWRDVITDRTAFQNSREVWLNPVDTERKVIHVFLVKVQDQWLVPTAYVDRTDAEGMIVSYSLVGDDPTRVLLNVPAEETLAREVSALVAFEPVDPSECLPELLTTTYYEAIRAGVLARIYGHVGLPYANERMFMLMSRKYASEIAKARVMAIHGHTTGAMPWSFPSYA